MNWISLCLCWVTPFLIVALVGLSILPVVTVVVVVVDAGIPALIL